MKKCPGCAAEFSENEGPNHKYFGESAGCWKAYGEVLAREYEDVNYWKVHRLTVDVYAVQHPFNKDRRNVQSVNIHLMALYVILDLGRPFEDVPPLLRKAAISLKDEFEYLDPPHNLGEITVKDILGARSASEHQEKVWAWARSVWGAWEPQRHLIIELLQKTEAIT